MKINSKDFRARPADKVKLQDWPTPARDSIRRQPEPYWKRAHRDWRMWVGLLFMLAVIPIYVMSNDLTFFALGHRQPPVSDTRGK
jgi:hypothetical protein